MSFRIHNPKAKAPAAKSKGIPDMVLNEQTFGVVFTTLRPGRTVVRAWRPDMAQTVKRFAPSDAMLVTLKDGGIVMIRDADKEDGEAKPKPTHLKLYA